MKVLIVSYTALNFGDDLFIYILAYRYPQIDFYIEMSELESIRYQELLSLCPNLTPIIKRSALKKITDRIRYTHIDTLMCLKYDAAVMIGGSVFMENPIDNTNGRLFKQLVRLFKKRGMFVLSSNFGPYISQSYLNLYRSCFRKCSDVCFRERFSADIFRDIKSVRYAPDVGFMMSRSRDCEENTLGISVIDISKRKGLENFWYEYLSFIAKLANQHIDNDGKVSFFSFCDREGDTEAIEKVLESIKNTQNTEIIKYTGNIETFMDKYLSMEKVAATRFHAIVLAAVNGIACMPISYSGKTDHVIKEMGLYDNIVPISDNMTSAGYQYAKLPVTDYSEVFKKTDEKFGYKTV